jgi:hypothetical protein
VGGQRPGGDRAVRRTQADSVWDWAGVIVGGLCILSALVWAQLDRGAAIPPAAPLTPDDLPEERRPEWLKNREYVSPPARPRACASMVGPCRTRGTC